jgi:4-hydroxy-3-methylbut-2-enyl diphosphate reductase
VDLGLRGFLPASHVRTRNVHALDRFIGQSLKVKIIEVDRARKRVVVSHKDAVEEERRRRRERTLGSIEENKVYRGVVRRITNYGAFVDLGGVDGLLHITEMSWTRINEPADVVKVGDKIDVMVLRFDRERGRISLGLKQILPDPWEDVPRRYKVGQVAHGAVTRVVPFGAFVRLESGIEGIIPNAELPGARGQRAGDLLATGQEVDVRIINIRPAERRMTLSLRQFEQAKERQQVKEYMQRQEGNGRVTIGDLFGSVLAGTQAAQQQPEEVAEVSAPPEMEAPDDSEKAEGEEGGREEEVAAQAMAEEPAREEPGASEADSSEPEAPGSAENEHATPTPEGEQQEREQEGGVDTTCSSSESPVESEAAKD